MGKRFTLFTGQWADLPFEEVARLAAGWGYDGLEIACWGDHLDASRWDDAEYVASRHESPQRVAVALDCMQLVVIRADIDDAGGPNRGR